MRRILPTRLRQLSGFTLVEVVIVMVIVGVIFPVFATLLVNMYHDSVVSREMVSMSTEANTALYYMDESVRNSHAFLIGVPEEFPDAYGPHNLGTGSGQAWSYKGDSAKSRVLISKNYATSTNPQNSTRTPVFIYTPAFNCTTEMYYQPQLSYLAIYFVRDNTLYRRTLTDTDTPLCAGSTQQQKTSCPPDVPVGERDASCAANDETLATRVSEFSIVYYQTSVDGDATALDPDYTSEEPTALASADYALVTLELSSRGGKSTHKVTHRITKINQ